MASGTSWHVLHRHDSQRHAWILDDGSVMSEPPVQESGSGRRIRLASDPECADYAKNYDTFITVAAERAARQNGRRLWISLGKGGGNTLDAARASSVVSSTLNAPSPEPHFLQGPSRSAQETKVAWRFKHQKMPLEAQIEVRVYKERWGAGWFVETKVIYPGTWCGNASKPVYFAATTDNKWANLATDAPEDVRTSLQEWVSKHPISWCDGFDIGTKEFDSERQAVNAFAKVCRAIEDLEDIEIPNLLNLSDREKASKQIEMLSLHVYKTNFDQDFLDTLSDFLQGDKVVEQIRAKWSELNALFRKLGMIIEDPKDSDWWNFMVQGADHAPLEVKLNPVTDEGGEQSRTHSVMINLATGTVVVACSASSTRDEAAIAYDTALLKAELTGQRDHFLAFADKYIEERQDGSARQMMKDAVKQAKTK